MPRIGTEQEREHQPAPAPSPLPGLPYWVSFAPVLREKPREAPEITTGGILHTHAFASQSRVPLR